MAAKELRATRKDSRASGSGRSEAREPTMLRAKGASRRLTARSASAQEAQYAAGACLVALRNPSPPCRRASCARVWAGGGKSEAASAERSAERKRSTVASSIRLCAVQRQGANGILRPWGRAVRKQQPGDQGVLQGREGVQQACLAGQHRVQVSLNELRCADRDAEGN